jgi:hypothetical protein
MPTKTKTRARKSPKKTAASRRCAEATGSTESVARELYECLQRAYKKAAIADGDLTNEHFMPWVKKRRLNERKDRQEVAAYRAGAAWILARSNAEVRGPSK